MKILSIIILISQLFIFGSSQNVNSAKPSQRAEQDCIEAIKAHDVQSFYSENPESQIRNQAEIWDERVFIPKVYHD